MQMVSKAYVVMCTIAFAAAQGQLCKADPSALPLQDAVSLLQIQAEPSRSSKILSGQSGQSGQSGPPAGSIKKMAEAIKEMASKIIAASGGSKIGGSLKQIGGKLVEGTKEGIADMSAREKLAIHNEISATQFNTGDGPNSSKGKKIRLKGLQGKKYLNGELGTLVRYNANAGRWVVKLDDSHKNGGEELSVKAQNLIPEFGKYGSGGGGANDHGVSAGGGAAAAAAPAAAAAAPADAAAAAPGAAAAAPAAGKTEVQKREERLAKQVAADDAARAAERAVRTKENLRIEDEREAERVKQRKIRAEAEEDEKLLAEKRQKREDQQKADADEERKKHEDHQAAELKKTQEKIAADAKSSIEGAKKAQIEADKAAAEERKKNADAEVERTKNEQQNVKTEQEAKTAADTAAREAIEKSEEERAKAAAADRKKVADAAAAKTKATATAKRAKDKKARICAIKRSHGQAC